MSSFTNWFTALGDSDAWTTFKSADTIIAENEDEIRINAEAQAQAEADQAAAEKKAIEAAASAESEKLRKRRGMKATILTDTDQDTLGAAPTQKAQMLG